MTDSQFILSVLEDGQKHSQADLLRRSFNERNCGLTVHSRVADLRKQGHYILTERVPGAERGEAWTYQLVASPSTPPLSDASLPLENGWGGVEGEGEQVPLFPSATHKSPDWA